TPVKKAIGIGPKEAIMNRRLVGTVVGIFVCATVTAHGQSHHSTKQKVGGQGHGSSSQSTNMYMIYPPPTPQEKRRIHQAGDLARTAAAALDAGQYREAEADARESLSLD